MNHGFDFFYFVDSHYFRFANTFKKIERYVHVASITLCKCLHKLDIQIIYINFKQSIQKF